MAQRSSSHSTQPIDAEQVRALTVRQLTDALPLRVDGYAYTDPDIYTLLVAAAAEQRSLESASHQFVGAPSANLVRHYLDDRLLWPTPVDELEERLNALFTACLPPGLVGKRVRLAIDVTLLPYYGSYAEEPGEIRRGEAKAGTTRFHAYASAYAIWQGRRVIRVLCRPVSNALNRRPRLGRDQLHAEQRGGGRTDGPGLDRGALRRGEAWAARAGIPALRRGRPGAL